MFNLTWLKRNVRTWPGVLLSQTTEQDQLCNLISSSPHSLGTAMAIAGPDPTSPPDFWCQAPWGQGGRRWHWLWKPCITTTLQESRIEWGKEIMTHLESFSFLLFLPLAVGSFISCLENTTMLMRPKTSLKGNYQQRSRYAPGCQGRQLRRAHEPSVLLQNLPCTNWEYTRSVKVCISIVGLKSRKLSKENRLTFIFFLVHAGP